MIVRLCPRFFSAGRYRAPAAPTWSLGDSLGPNAVRSDAGALDEAALGRLCTLAALDLRKVADKDRLLGQLNHMIAMTRRLREALPPPQHEASLHDSFHALFTTSTDVLERRVAGDPVPYRRESTATVDTATLLAQAPLPPLSDAYYLVPAPVDDDPAKSSMSPEP